MSAAAAPAALSAITSAAEPAPIYYDKNAFVTTKFGNKISKKSVLCGPAQIVVKGKTIIESKAVIRGDLAPITIGQCSLIAENCVIRPPAHRHKGAFVFVGVGIGDHTTIERDTIVEAANIGNGVHIGRGAVIGKRCIISDCSRIEPNAVLAAGTVVPPFCVFGGSPAVCVGKLPESYQSIAIENSTAFFRSFQPKKD